jgi:hypothetical protein
MTFQNTEPPKPPVLGVLVFRSIPDRRVWDFSMGRIVLDASGGAGASARSSDGSSLHGVINDRGLGGLSVTTHYRRPTTWSPDLARVSPDVKADGVRNVGFQLPGR